jgi:hypothetical protein
MPRLMFIARITIRVFAVHESGVGTEPTSNYVRYSVASLIGRNKLPADYPIYGVESGHHRLVMSISAFDRFY